MKIQFENSYVLHIQLNNSLKLVYLRGDNQTI